VGAVVLWKAGDRDRPRIFSAHPSEKHYPEEKKTVCWRRRKCPTLGSRLGWVVPAQPILYYPEIMYMFSRRQFIGLSAGAAALGQVRLCKAEALRRASRPTPPYRVWFQPRCYHRDMSLYRHMTVDASGWLDPMLCELTGKAGLRWVYGTNHPYAKGPWYWRRECSVSNRSTPKDKPEFLGAGVAIDEWVRPKRPELEAFVAEGLRAARKADPSIFICVWYTDLRPKLVELIHDGTVDLAIIEGYTHTPERYGSKAWLHWTTCLRRCEAAAKAKTLSKTIFCFGHITDEPNAKKEYLQMQWLDEKCREIKKRYPAMPGVAFYQSDSPDTPKLRTLVKHCDELSGELWK